MPLLRTSGRVLLALGAFTLPATGFVSPTAYRTAVAPSLRPPVPLVRESYIPLSAGQRKYARLVLSDDDNGIPEGDRDDSLFDPSPPRLEMDTRGNSHPIANFLSMASTALQSFLKKLDRQRAIAVVAMVLMISIFFFPLSSMAVESGGRMGGGSFSSGRSSSSYSRSSGSSGYGGGSGYYGGGGGYSSYRPRTSTNVIVSPGYSYSPFGFFSSPFRTFNPWYNPGPTVVVSRGPSFFDFFFFGAVGLILWSSFVKPRDDEDWGEESGFRTMTRDATSVLGSGVSVLKLSVALDVPRRNDPGSILSKLRKLSETARTDNRVGIQNLTSQVAMELLRQKSSIVSASSSYNHFRDYKRAEREFNSMAVRERSKFEREIISKYKGVDYGQEQQRIAPGEYLPDATMAVVTLVLAIEGDSTKVSSIRSERDVINALTRIATDAKVDDCLQSVEILWTPEDATETLTKRELVSDYPELRDI